MFLLNVPFVRSALFEIDITVLVFHINVYINITIFPSQYFVFLYHMCSLQNCVYVVFLFFFNFVLAAFPMVFWRHLKTMCVSYLCVSHLCVHITKFTERIKQKVKQKKTAFFFGNVMYETYSERTFRLIIRVNMKSRYMLNFMFRNAFFFSTLLRWTCLTRFCCCYCFCFFFLR